MGANMPEATEQMEHALHAEHASHSSRKIGLLIAVLALFLSFSETLGKSAQTEAISANVKSREPLGIFPGQDHAHDDGADRRRRTQAHCGNASDPAARAAMEKQIEAWRKNAARYNSEPDTGEGRKELSAHAKEAEKNRDLAMAKYHHYEVASAAFQIGIVLASAAVITELIGLAWFAGVLGLTGIRR